MTLPPTPANPAAADGSDPSMEEILASIRRILNEDESPESAAEEPPTAPPADDDVLLLDHSMLISPPAGAVELAALEAEEAAAMAIKPIGSDEIELEPRSAEAEPDSWEREVAASQAQEAAVAADPFDDPPPQPAAVTPAAPATPMPFFPEALVAPETAAATASSVDGLLRALSSNRATQVYRGGPTIEDLVREELRPLLKQWLDAHLPPVVERAVRAEIERVVGRAVP